MIMSQWVGQAVSIECYDLGVFQGLVESVDSDTSTVTLKNAFKDGKPCDHRSISILSSQIRDLNFIDSTPVLQNLERYSRIESSDDDRPPARHKVENKKPAKVVRAKTMTHEDAPANNGRQRRRSNSCTVADTDSQHGHNSPRRTDYPHHRYSNQRSQQGAQPECFNVSVQSCMGDFDFEKNLAKFDKQRVFTEIENSTGSRLTPKKPAEKYKHDEMVIKPAKATKQIKMINEAVESDSFSYTTDDGLVIPCITFNQREQLYQKAAAHGLTEQRLVDMVGRNTCDMVFQLIGGSNRLNPHNTHQTPTVILFCGSHIQGSFGLNCARHLANHNIKTVVFTPEPAAKLLVFSQELALYDLCGNRRISKPEELPTGAIDLIINCLDSQHANINSEPWYKYVSNWCSTSRAHVLAIDPSTNGCSITAKWSVHIGFPQRLPRSAGQTYLCDVALPKQIFSHIGVKYRSPFGIKFCIPLHSE